MRPRARGDELRIALSMRGGVSLAVWIGGAVEEIDRLTRADATKYEPSTAVGPPDFYDALLKMSGYERAAVDVITGASAGGLNGVVLAASRAYGFRFASMLPIWIRLGDIELLTRDPRERPPDPVTGKKSRRLPSLLRGDEYFLEQLSAELTKLVESGHDEYVVQDPFELILSATLANPEYETTEEDPFAPLPEVRRNATFAFRFLGEAGDNGGDFQQRSDAVASKRDSTVSLLALAGRSTSSFPVAFEPASVGPDAIRVFSDAPQPEAPPCRVLDGGVLDNIPVTKAIEAIAAAPVAGKAERWLVFLHPSPSAKTKTAPDLQASPQAMGTLLSTASAAFGQESLLDDLDELERHNAEVRRQRLRRQALLRTIAPDVSGSSVPASVHQTAEKLRCDTPVVRAKLDAARVLRILSGKLRVRRPLTDGPDRAKWSEWLNTVRRQLEDDIATGGTVAYRTISGQFPDLYPRPAVLSTGGLFLACNLVSSWVREIPIGQDDGERSAALLETSAQVVSELRRVVQTALNWSDQAWLVAASSGPKIDLPWASSIALLAAESTRRVPATELQDLANAFGLPMNSSAKCSATLDRSPVDLSAAVGPPLRRLDETMRAQVMAGTSLSSDESEDLALWVWHCLVRVVNDSAGVAPPDTVNADTETRRRSQTMHELLSLIRNTITGRRREQPHHGIDDLDDTIKSWREDRSHRLLALAGREGMADVTLADLVTVLTPAQAAMLENDEEVRFVRISGNNETPLEHIFVDDGQPFGVDEKLCGNELGNFAAFCSARWRANDWMWGRLDAVKSIVDLTMRPERLNTSQMAADEIRRTVLQIASSAGMTLSGQQIDALTLEIEVAKRGEPNPDGTALVCSVLTEAMQRRIFASMRRLISVLGERPYWPGESDAASLPISPEVSAETLNAQMRSYNVGSETIRDLNSRRRTQIGMRLALVAHTAFRPFKKDLVSRACNLVMTLTKPFYLFAAFAVLNVARAVFLINVIAVGFWLGPWRFRGDSSSLSSIWQVAIYDERPRVWEMPASPQNPVTGAGGFIGLGFIACLTLVSLYLAIRNRRQRTARLQHHLKPPPGFGWYLASFAVGVVGLLGNYAYGVNAGPLFMAISASFLALGTCLWMRHKMLLLVWIGTFASHALVATVWHIYARTADTVWLGYTGWMSIAALLTSQAYLTVLCTRFKVLHNEESLMAKATKAGKKLAGTN